MFMKDEAELASSGIMSAFLILQLQVMNLSLTRHGVIWLSEH